MTFYWIEQSAVIKDLIFQWLDHVTVVTTTLYLYALSEIIITILILERETGILTELIDSKFPEPESPEPEFIKGVDLKYWALFWSAFPGIVLFILNVNHLCKYL
jgi:hypothetical protein